MKLASCRNGVAFVFIDPLSGHVQLLIFTQKKRDEEAKSIGEELKRKAKLKEEKEKKQKAKQQKQKEEKERKEKEEEEQRKREQQEIEAKRKKKLEEEEMAAAAARQKAKTKQHQQGGKNKSDTKKNEQNNNKNTTNNKNGKTLSGDSQKKKTTEAQVASDTETDSDESGIDSEDDKEEVVFGGFPFNEALHDAIHHVSLIHSPPSFTLLLYSFPVQSFHIQSICSPFLAGLGRRRNTPFESQTMKCLSFAFFT